MEFDEWFEKIKELVKKGVPIVLLGPPATEDDFRPESDEYVKEWAAENKQWFETFYKSGEGDPNDPGDPMFALTMFVC